MIAFAYYYAVLVGWISLRWKPRFTVHGYLLRPQKCIRFQVNNVREHEKFGVQKDRCRPVQRKLQRWRTNGISIADRHSGRVRNHDVNKPVSFITHVCVALVYSSTFQKMNIVPLLSTDISFEYLNLKLLILGWYSLSLTHNHINC